MKWSLFLAALLALNACGETTAEVEEAPGCDQEAYQKHHNG